jgi:hypothetical protein
VSDPKGQGSWLWVVIVSDAVVAVEDDVAVDAVTGGAATLDAPQDAAKTVSATTPRRTTA